MIRAYRGALPRLGKNAYIDEQACVIGDVETGDDVSVWPMAVVRGDVNFIRIGHRSNVQDGAVLHTDMGSPLTLGDDVTVGHQAMLHGCTIGTGSLIGMQAIILNNAKIGKNCLIGAGAIVPEGREIPDGSLVIGVGKIMRTLSEEEIKGMHHNIANYAERGQMYRQKLKRIDR